MKIRTLITTIVVILGIALIAVSSCLRQSDWVSSLLLNLGVTTFLAIPLQLVTSWAGREIKSVKSDVEEDVANLRTETDVKIEELKHRYEARESIIREGSTDRTGSNSAYQKEDDILDRVMRLSDAGAVSREGMIFPFYLEERAYLRMLRDGDGWRISGVDASEVFGNGPKPSIKIGKEWRWDGLGGISSLSAQAMHELNEDGIINNDKAFSITDFVHNLDESVSGAERCYKMYQGENIGGYRVLANDFVAVNDSWMICDDSLLALRTHYPANFGRPDGYGWRNQLLDKVWVDNTGLDYAMRWSYALGLATAAWVEGRNGQQHSSWSDSKRLED